MVIRLRNKKLYWLMLLIFLTVAQPILAQQKCDKLFNECRDCFRSFNSVGPKSLEELSDSLQNLIQNQFKVLPAKIVQSQIFQDIYNQKISFHQAFHDLYENGKMNAIFEYSKISPQILPGGRAIIDGFGPGLVLYKGNIFINSYFLQNGLLKRGVTASLTKNQPYFSYNPQSQKFEYHSSGAQNEIIRLFLQSHQPEDQILIARGVTSLQEQQIEQVIQKTADSILLSQEERATLSTQLTSASTEWQVRFGQSKSLSEELLSRFRILSSQLLLSKFSIQQQNELSQNLAMLFIDSNDYMGKDSIFVTTNPQLAKTWGRHLGVISIFISAADLARYANNGDIYVGIEGDIEIALISSQVQQLFLQNGSFK